MRGILYTCNTLIREKSTAHCTGAAVDSIYVEFDHCVLFRAALWFLMFLIWMFKGNIIAMNVKKKQKKRKKALINLQDIFKS